jgi:polyphosphate glucokinase
MAPDSQIATVAGPLPSAGEGRQVLGIDIGGTGIKGAPVDVDVGVLAAERFRILTPQPATPKAVSAKVGEIVEHFKWEGSIGCGFPAAIRSGEVKNAANISKKWIGQDVEQLLARAAGREVVVLNDADAAGVSEMRFGAGREQKGTVLVVTLGTGIGTALFVNGHLVPNTELGHIEIDGRDAETWCSASAREKKKLPWKKWAQRVDVYLKKLQFYVWPDLIILGGGISRKHERFIPYLQVETKVVPARMLNQAGIIGAAASVQQSSRWSP